jgi:hypothetical protein
MTTGDVQSLLVHLLAEAERRGVRLTPEQMARALPVLRQWAVTGQAHVSAEDLAADVQALEAAQP